MFAIKLQYFQGINGYKNDLIAIQEVKPELYVDLTQLAEQNKWEKNVAEGGFDPPTFGLWAQHAPAAPLCWYLNALKLLINKTFSHWCSVSLKLFQLDDLDKIFKILY